MGQREKGLLNVPLGHAVGPIFVALPAFVFHYVTLGVKPFLVQGVQQEAHAVGLQPQHQLQVVGWHILPVVGAVSGGGTVEGRADFLQRLEVAGLVMTGAAEHDVLKEVGEAGASNLLVLGAHVVPDVDRSNGNGTILMQDYIETVGQGVFLKSDASHKSAFSDGGTRQKCGGYCSIAGGRGLPAGMCYDWGARTERSWPRAMYKTVRPIAAVNQRRGENSAGLQILLAS